MINKQAVEKQAVEKSLRQLDRQFSLWLIQNFTAELDNRDQQLLQRLAMAVSYAIYLKHSCIDLDIYPALRDPVLNQLLQGIDADITRRLVTTAVKPLICSADGKRVWLHKYYCFEKKLAENLLRLAEENRLQIITGGPGTGKTWTAAQYIKTQCGTNPALRLLLAAPTGKAANNLMNALAEPHVDSTGNSLTAQTLHALLGFNRHSPKPRYHTQHPLPVDVLIVDEASMVDLPMMFHLLQALPAEATLMLLGDKDQLASVEAGSVLHEICQASVFSKQIRILPESRRYRDSPEIGHLAEALNIGLVPDMTTNRNVLRHQLAVQNPWQPAWLPQALQHFRDWQSGMAGHTLEELLARQKHFQILCALREGPQGVNGINAMITGALGHKMDDWYAGRPLMITQNDHERKLYNGDMGVVWSVNGELKACFIVEGVVKILSRAQMPPHETCYAITVHKSQGSEYERVLIVLPSEASDAQLNPVLTRELVYTAVTRAKQSLDVWCGEGVLEVTASKTLQRMSGLKGLCADAVLQNQKK